ncbi:Lar family restriction alleviation protein [Candidatus Bathyarchaeota archaeon]|nr:Lar family restriction alleviation protein [Candidatus Bathyarchaeota archaeon]
MADFSLGRIFRLMSQCSFCGSESVEEDWEGRFSPDTIVIKCRQCGKRIFITGKQILEVKSKLITLGDEV